VPIWVAERHLLMPGPSSKNDEQLKIVLPRTLKRKLHLAAKRSGITAAEFARVALAEKIEREAAARKAAKEREAV
jgi:hypothetical protein